MSQGVSCGPHKIGHYTGHDYSSDQEECEVEDNTNSNHAPEPYASGANNVYKLPVKPLGENGIYDLSRLEDLIAPECNSFLQQDAAAQWDNNMNSENVIMEKLFEACDHQGKGRVRVSDLVDYLRTIVDTHLHEDGAVGSLIAILDPDNNNTEIGSEEFHSGLHKWIAEMKCSSLEMSTASSQEDSVSYDVKCQESVASSIEESIMEDRLSVSDLSNRLTDYQFLNRKLVTENHESRAIIDSKEEELLRYTKELHDAKLEIKRLQELADFRHEAEAENEELRQQMLAQSKDIDMERHKAHQAEQEKLLLHSQVQRYQAQVVKLTAELTQSRQSHEELKSWQLSSKEKIAQLKEIIASLDAQLSEKDEHFQDLQACLREFSKNNEDLKNQNQELQGQLIHMQQELHSLKNDHGVNSDGHLPSLKILASEIEEDFEQSDSKGASKWPVSIRNELKDLFSDSPSLPWPLSEKELKESIVAAPDLVSQVGNATSYSNDDKQSVNESGDGQCPGLSTDSSMRERCQCDYHYDMPIEKLRMLVSLFRTFKEENQKLKHFIKQTFMDSQPPPMKPAKVDRQHDSQHEAPTSLEEEVVFLKQCLSESEAAVNHLQKFNEKLVLEVTKLKRSNVEYAEKLHKSELKLCELSEEAQNTSASLDKEKQRCVKLEETLCTSTLARQLDLRDIWRLVQKDVERECQDTQDDNTQLISAEQIKENIKNDLEALRTKLRKREAALGALKRKNLNLPLLWDYNDGYVNSNWYNGRKLSPGSPLVDALTIDVFNGNFPMYQPKYPYPPSVVSCEDVDCGECRAARLVLQSRYTSSCPIITQPRNNNQLFIEDLDDTNVGLTQTDFDGSHSSPKTGETVAGSDFSITGAAKRQRSLYGSHRRQDFIRRSGKFLEGHTDQHSRFDRQSWSVDDSRKSHKITSDNYENSINNNSKNDLLPVSEDNTFHIGDPTASSFASDSNDLEPPVGIRRPSFTYAVEQSQWERVKPSHVAQEYETQRDHCTFTEELRRPSFRAAIEHGKDNASVSKSCVNFRGIGHALPENSHSPGKPGLISNAKKSKNEKNESNAARSEPSKSVKFNLEESDAEPYGGVYTGALAWGITGNKANFDAIASASVASSSFSSSTSSAMSSFSTPGDLSRSLSLSSRSGSNEGKKLNIFIEELHRDDMAKSMEDWDLSPNNNSFSYGFLSRIEPGDESIETSVMGEREGEEKTSKVSGKEYAQVPDDDMPTSMNHNSLSVKEVIKGQSTRDGPAHSTPERCAKHQEGKSSNPSHSSNSSQSHGTRRGHAATTSTANRPLPPSSSPLSSPPTSTTKPPSTTTTPSSVSVSTGQSSSKQSEGKEGVGTEKRNGNGSPHSHSEDSSGSCEVETSRSKTVVPSSPPTARNSLSVTQQAQPLNPSRLSKIRQNHLASKKREQMKSRSMKLPELSEHAELDTTSVHSTPPTANGPVTLNSESTPPPKVMPQISVTSVDSEIPPAPSEDPVTPSLPDAFLKKLGLAVKGSGGDDDENDVNVDQLPEKDVESKFISLSLAFKTDKLTLDQRVSVQERSRDLAEQNVDTELQGLRDAVEALSELVADTQVRNMLQKIKQHIDILEQSAARVSSRAEVFGAVQQERRMCKAMEVMVLYTENLRRIREREESELQEARKVLSERSGNGFSLDSESGPARRSMSVCGFGAGGRPHFTSRNWPSSSTSGEMRRRSEVALPRVLGGIGSPSLTPTASLENTPSFLERSNFSALSQESDEGEDPKSRFQSAVASTSMQHVVTNTMRRASLDKQRSLSVSSTSSMSPVSTPASPFFTKTPPSTLTTTKEVGEESTPESSADKTDAARKISKDEEAFRKGFEEGLKTKLSQELNELREQQNTISHNLDHVMDKVDQSQLEDEEYFSRPSRLESAIALASTVGGYIIEYDWRSNKKLIRNIAGVFLILLAILVVFLSPPISTVDVRHFPKPPQ